MSNDNYKNSSTNITLFNWDKYPVETKNLSVCICLKNNQTKDDKIDTDKLVKYIKLLFPEETFFYTDVCDYVKYKKNINTSSSIIQNTKSTLIFNIDELSNTHWSDNLAILQGYLNKGYFIIIGDYDKIPKIVTTTSDIMIFEDQEITNKYLSDKHKFHMSNFNIDSYYILIDKRNLNMKIHVLSKNQINQYI